MTEDPHPETKQIVYDELDEQINRIDDVLERFEANDLTHTPAYVELQQRRSHFCMMRGYLNRTCENDLRSNDETQ